MEKYYGDLTVTSNRKNGILQKALFEIELIFGQERTYKKLIN